MLLQLVDGGILDFKSDSDYSAGCETCDYGSKYTNYHIVELTTRTIRIEASQMYEYPLSDGQMMKIIFNNILGIQSMTEKEFTKWLNLEFLKVFPDIQFSIYEKGDED